MLQTCTTQRKLIFSATRATQPRDFNLIILYLKNYEPRLLHQLAFQIPVFVKTKQVFRMVIDK